MLVIVIALGDYATAFFAGFSVVSNTFFGMIQEFNAKRQLDQLAALSEQSVTCLRDGDWVDVPMRAVVKDEIIRIEPGDRLVVDGVVVQADSLEMDESHLTGESDAVGKSADEDVFSGSFCIAGAGIMRATRVGADSHINRLSVIAKQYKVVKTPTQVKIDITVEITVLIMLVFVPMIFVTGFYLQQRIPGNCAQRRSLHHEPGAAGFGAGRHLVADHRRGQNQPPADADPARQCRGIAGQRDRTLFRQNRHADAEQAGRARDHRGSPLSSSAGGPARSAYLLEESGASEQYRPSHRALYRSAGQSTGDYPTEAARDPLYFGP